MQAPKVLIFVTRPFLSTLVCSFSSLAKIPQSPNPILQDYLRKNFQFSEEQAFAVSCRYHYLNSLEKPQSVVRFLKATGFSDAQIPTAARSVPQILFSNVDRVIKPKIRFFQDMGFSGSAVSKLVVSNPLVLVVSLKKKLIPCLAILKRILLDDKNNKDLAKVLRRCKTIVSGDPKSLLLPNTAFFKSCGIVGSQLAMLLRRQPKLFISRESILKDLVSRASNMGFSMDSRMFVHGLYSVSCLSSNTFEKKVRIFKKFGIAKDECFRMFVIAPSLIRSSETKLMLGIDFFLNEVKLERDGLVRRPVLLLHSLKGRAIPRYAVMEIIKTKKLLGRQPSFPNVLGLTEEEFLEKYILRFSDDAEEILTVYRSHILDESSEEGESLI